jgi:hypothetical protein
MRLWHVVAGVIVGCVLFAGAAVAAPRLVADPAALIFTTPDGSRCEALCLFGIEVGETSYEEAIDLLEAHPLTRDMERADSLGRNGTIFRSPNVAVGLTRDAYGRLVTIDMAFEPQRAARKHESASQIDHLQLGQLVAAFDAPNYVELSDFGIGHGVRAYFADRMQVVASRVDEERINPYDIVRYVFVYSNNLTVRPGMYAWRGFVSYDPYFSSYFSRP